MLKTTPVRGRLRVSVAENRVKLFVVGRLSLLWAFCREENIRFPLKIIEILGIKGLQFRFQSPLVSGELEELPER